MNVYINETISLVNVTSSRSGFGFVIPTHVEILLTIISLLSAYLNAVTYRTVSAIRVRTKTAFLLSIEYVILTELILCTVRVVHGLVSWCPGRQDYLLLTLLTLVVVIQFFRNWWLVVVTLFRALMILWPLHSKRFVTSSAVHRALLINLVLAAATPSTILVVYLTHDVDFDTHDLQLAADPEGSEPFFIPLLSASVGVPLAMVAALTCCIVASLTQDKHCCQSTASSLELQYTPTSALAVQLRLRPGRHITDQFNISSRRATRTVVLIAICTIIFQFPFYLFALVFFTSGSPSDLQLPFYISWNLLFLDTLSNCLVLLGCNPSFRMAFIQRIVLCARATPLPPPATPTPSQTPSSMARLSTAQHRISQTSAPIPLLDRNQGQNHV